VTGQVGLGRYQQELGAGTDTTRIARGLQPPDQHHADTEGRRAQQPDEELPQPGAVPGDRYDRGRSPVRQRRPDQRVALQLFSSCREPVEVLGGVGRGADAEDGLPGRAGADEVAPRPASGARRCPLASAWPRSESAAGRGRSGPARSAPGPAWRRPPASRLGRAGLGPSCTGAGSVAGPPAPRPRRECFGARPGPPARLSARDPGRRRARPRRRPRRVCRTASVSPRPSGAGPAASDTAAATLKGGVRVLPGGRRRGCTISALRS
jgi:hypothetical protein